MLSNRRANLILAHIVMTIRFSILTALCLAVPALFGASSCHSPEKDDAKAAQTAFHAELRHEITRANQLTFATMAVTKTAVADDSRMWGKRIGVFSYDTHLRAYINLYELTDADIRFDDEARTVDITLPPIRIDISGRDMALREEYTNIGILRRRFDSRERADAKNIANADFRRELERDSSYRERLAESARRKARAYYEAFFADNGYSANISFK